MHSKRTSITPLMSTQSLARFTAAVALDLVKSSTDLSETQRRDLASAVNAVVKAAGLPADAVLLTPEGLRSTFLTLSASMLGVSEGRMRNIRSCLRRVLRLVGMIDDDDTPLSDAWSALLELVTDKERACLIAFARFCSARQIDPGEVTSEVLAAFEDHLTTRTLCPKPHKRTGEVLGAWNRHRRSIPGWPNTLLARAADPRQYILPLEAFPEAFQAELQAKAKHLASTPLDDPFELDIAEADSPDDRAITPLRRPLRPSSITTRMDHYRWAASALVASGAVSVDEITGLASLVTPIERVKRGLRFLYQRAGKKPSAGGSHVAEIFHMIAKHDVGLPEKDLAQIRDWGDPVRLKYNGMTRKNETTIRSAMEPPHEAALLGLPDQLMQAARKEDLSPGQARGLALRAVTIALLTAIPLRLSNVVGLRLDLHLHRADPKRRHISAIIIDGSETKNGEQITMPVSRRLSGHVEEWIRSFRGTGAAAASPWLFPGLGTNKGPVTPQGLRAAITDATASYAGVRLSPHQFRHLAARRFLEEYPGHYEEVRQLLGHKRLDTTVNHYAGIRTEETLRRLDEIVQRGGKGPRRPPSGPNKPRKGTRRGS